MSPFAIASLHEGASTAGCALADREDAERGRIVACKSRVRAI
jgi:hypothetical protein